MKKLYLIFVILSSCGILNLNAQEKFVYENTTWRIIRERLFNGNNSKAYRYEEDIRIQLKGFPDQSDSMFLKKIIDDLKPLIKTVDIKLVDKDANFIITILSPEVSEGYRTNQIFNRSKISCTELYFNPVYFPTLVDKEGSYYYYIVRHLTKLFEPQTGRTGYGGIFDKTDKPEQITFTEIDKDLIKKLYSKNFYKGLRENTIKQLGHLSYLDLRYHYPLKYISTLLGIMLSILGLLYLVLKQSYIKTEVNFLGYLKKGAVILFGISIIYPLFTLSQGLFYLRGESLFFFFVANMFKVYVIGFMIVSMMFFIERFIRQKTIDFVQRQFLFFTSTIFSILFAWFFVSRFALYLYNEFYVFPVKVPVQFNFTILFVAIVVSSLRTFFDFLNYRVQSMVNQKDVELSRMKELKNQAELNALQSRINPHFLYNSLNSIAGLAHTDPDKTENMATSLSELFRYSINKEDKTYVSVDDELEMVKKYLEIEKVRFGEKLDYTIETEEGMGVIQVPKFLIQPLVENAVKHGLSKITGKGILRVAVKREGDDLIIRVYDNGPDFPKELISGYGLQNLYDKLKILYSEEAILNWQNGGNKHIQVTLKNQFRS